MSWEGRIHFGMDQPLTAWERLRVFFGHYDLRVYLTQNAYIDLGAGSLTALRKVRAGEWHVGSLGRIGRFCEFSECDILFGLEHLNNDPINVTFGSTPVLRQLNYPTGQIPGVAEATPINIGDNVVVSINATILSGATIGNGAVIAAGAVVKGDVEPFAIYGGVPARKLRDRFPTPQREQLEAVAWWNFSTAYLGEVLPRLNELALLPSRTHRYRVERPRFAVLVEDLRDKVRFLGVVIDDQVADLAAQPRPVADYVAQAFSSQPHTWLADVWAHVT